MHREQKVVQHSIWKDKRVYRVNSVQSNVLFRVGSIKDPTLNPDNHELDCGSLHFFS